MLRNFLLIFGMLFCISISSPSPEELKVNFAKVNDEQRKVVQNFPNIGIPHATCVKRDYLRDLIVKWAKTLAANPEGCGNIPIFVADPSAKDFYNPEVVTPEFEDCFNFVRQFVVSCNNAEKEAAKEFAANREKFLEFLRLEEDETRNIG